MADPIARLLKPLGLTPKAAAQARIRYLTAQQAAKEAGKPLGPCLAFDYAFGDQVLGTRFRRLLPGEPRYYQRPGTGIHLYFPHVYGINWPAAIDGHQVDVLLITEGEKKALAVQAVLSHHPQLFPRHYCVSVPGTSTWSRQRPRTSEGETDRSERRELLPELVTLAKSGVRRAFVLFDSDKVGNEQVERDEELLMQRLGELGVSAASCAVPPGEEGAKQGIDDYLATMKSAVAKAKALRQLLDVAGTTSDSWPKHFASVEGAVAEMNNWAALLPSGKVLFRRAGEQRFMDPASSSTFIALAPQIMAPLGKDGEPKEVARHWLKDPLARRIDAEVRTRQLPSGLVEHEGVRLYNTFEPAPKYARPSAKDVARFVKPWLDLWAKQTNPADAMKLVAIMAMHWQGTRPTYSVVLAGRGGEGKSLTRTLFQNVFEYAPGYAFMLNAKSIESPRFFEAGTHGRLFVGVEEVADRRVFDLLKTQADDASSKEMKGKDAITSHNDALLVFVTNKPACIPLDQNSAVRRWAVWQLEHMLEAGEGAALHSLLSADGVVRTWRAFLQHFDWAKHVSAGNAPETAYREILREENEGEIDIVLDKLLAEPPSAPGTVGRVPWVFTVDELRAALNAKGLFANFKSPLSSKMVAQLLNERRSSDLIRVRDGDRVKLASDDNNRFWARGPKAEKLAVASTSELKLHR